MFRISTPRNRKGSLILAALVWTMVGTGQAQAVCDPGVGNVPVGVMAAADAPSTTARREHAVISEGLAARLGIDPAEVDFDGDESPQIRLTVDAPLLPDGRRATANFTVFYVVPMRDPVVWVFDRQSTTDRDSGYYKLVTDAAVAPYNVRVTVHPLAPGVSTITENGTMTIESFCEPSENGSRTFEEETWSNEDKRVALLIPHGGAIEVKTSDQRQPFVDHLATHWGVDTNVWEARGTWGSNHTFHRWHITSRAIFEPSFPALDYLESRPDFALGRPFQYVVSLHGYGDTAVNGVVLGGRASREAKCVVVQEIQSALASHGRAGEIAFHIFDVGGADLSIADGDGNTLSGIDHLKGLNESNITNRLSPNASGVVGHGGIQIEQSKCVRDEEHADCSGVTPTSFLRDLVAEGAAEAIGKLLHGITPPQACSPYEVPTI